MAPRHGIASDIREQREGAEEYDLAGYDGAAVEELVHAAFSSPIDATGPLRCTFIVGGGKKVRQKYPDSLAREMQRALQSLNFEEDRGASMVLDSQGTFKYHHDTDRDLKFVHVFPRVELKKGEDQSEKGNKEGEELSPEEQVTFCDFERFKPLVEKNVTSLSQKRELHKHLKRMQQVVEASEKKLSDMQELKEEESDIYHNAQDLPEKIEWLSKQMEKMVANGELTAQEKSDVQRQFKEKEEEIASEVERAKGEGKKADKRESQLNGLREKMANLSATDPKERKVKDESELIDCVSRLRELESLEKNMGKELYSLETVNKLKQKPELEKKIDSLKRQNVGWFEDASWLDRHIEKALKSRSAGKGRKNPDSSSSSSGRGSKNPDPSWNNAKRSGSHSKASSQRRAKPQDSGNPFAGLTD